MADTSKLRYTQTHEWVTLSGGIATVGITDHAQKEISDIVFVELPKAGREVKAKESVIIIESVKAAFDIYAPVTGTIVKINEKLKEHPEVVNRSPYEEGWLFQIECADLREFESLLKESDYLSVNPSAH